MERELIKRVADGDEHAFNVFFKLYKDRVFAYCYNWTQNYEDAEELAVETLYRVWKKAGSFRGDSKVSSWVFGIARKVCLEFMRSKKMVYLEIQEWDAVYEDSQEEWDTELVRDALESLDPLHREVLFLAYYEELPYEEIAKILGVPSGTVKSRVHNAKRKLREILEARGYGRQA